jgi:hypothetical protein
MSAYWFPCDEESWTSVRVYGAHRVRIRNQELI